MRGPVVFRSDIWLAIRLPHIGGQQHYWPTGPEVRPGNIAPVTLPQDPEKLIYALRSNSH